MKLDDKGRCCGRKPLVYKLNRGTFYPRGHFCARCDRSYNLDTGEQQENAGWRRAADGSFERRPPR